MDIVVTGRHIQISERFRGYLDERLGKIVQIAPKVDKVEVVVTHENTARNSECVELTCKDRGTVVRAEAFNDDKYAAVDLAVEKLVERLRRANSRRRTAIRGRGEPARAAVPVAPAVPVLAEVGAASGDPAPTPDGPFGAVGDSPIEVREKVHPSTPMTLGEAVNRMELVGHDFYLFNDADTGKASVVYRRRGWSYGVIHLEPTA